MLLGLTDVCRSVTGDMSTASSNFYSRTGEAADALRALRSELARSQPDLKVLVRPEELRAYECDGLSAYHRIPDAVALPETVEQVQAIMRACHQHRVPVVARGAGTGLSAGALPVEGALVLSLARLRGCSRLIRQTGSRG